MRDGDQAEKKTRSENAIPTTTDDNIQNNRVSGDEFGRAISKIAVAQICESLGFDSVNESALESLSNLAVKYLSDFSKAAKFHSNLAGRIESNVFDVMLGLEDLGVSGVSEIVEYVESTEDIPFAQPLPHFPVIKEKVSLGIPSFLQMGETPEFKHIPDWLPAFPDPHTYKSTTVWNERATDARADKVELARQRRKAERSLLSLQQRLIFNETSTSVQPDEDEEKIEVNGSQTPHIPDEVSPEARVEVNGSEKVVLQGVLPGKISEGRNENLVTLLDTFAPAIEAMKEEVSESGNRVEKTLPEKRHGVSLEFRTGKKVLGESLDLMLKNKNSGRTGVWFGRDDDKDDKKRRVEFILRQSMENQHDLS